MTWATILTLLQPSVTCQYNHSKLLKHVGGFAEKSLIQGFPGPFR
jgi:hypothetical protein